MRLRHANANLAYLVPGVKYRRRDPSPPIAFAAPPPQSRPVQHPNAQTAIAFYRTAFLGDPRAAVEQYVGDDYRQHNPAVADGPAGFIAYFERMHRDYPDKSIRFLRSVAEGDLVALHTHQIWPDGEEYVTMDFFRFDAAGKIVEHWDAIQRVPAEAANDNGMF